MATSPQRVWRAACPNCGAPVDFASAASASAVCGFCRSTLLRDGEALKRIGQSAELFDDHSPLQIGAAGRYMGSAFTVVGRQQLGDDQSRWTEWHVLFDGEAATRSGWLSEDNGAYVMAFDAPITGPLPAPDELVAGEQRLVNGAIWSVASLMQARVLAAQGELPAPPRLEGPPFPIADLRNTMGEVATLDWRDPARPGWSVGRAVRLAELAMSGLREVAEKTLAGRSIACPSCGASLEPKLSTTQSIVCGQCQAVVDVSQGIGGELRHYAQDNPGLPPQIPLGRTGTLQLGARAPALPWQVVGYAERCEVDVDPGEEQTAWREYLMYHREEGFAFLVDSEDGWSFARPVTGVPQVRGDRATWQGKTYDKLYSYTGAVTHVLGEFYWRLTRGERTRNTDFASGPLRLNREQVGNEVTWSAGEALDATVVAKAFGLGTVEAAAIRRDVTPLSTMPAGTKLRWIVIALVVVFVLPTLLSMCSSDDCDSTRSAFGESSNEYQQCLRNRSSGSRGGSFGGFSSGGGHK
ncbi:DUF4178 domain-containing protein [Ideonella sp. A 288]|uniref:DUF4178 domain-containing protein n=1 Tax=Ideonella sp. A 288 TaxID=1962181 RepID=UPI000B4C01BA|nr:DUF4178 domain-containing protein [Ideonella sp. A 288]